MSKSMLSPAVRALALRLLTFLICLVGLGSSESAFGQEVSEFDAALSQGVAKAAGVSFVAGFLTSLTPCVYPMIAITVSVFGAKQAKSRMEAMALSTAFVLGMVTLFTTMFVVVALTGGVFGTILQNKWVIVGIALVFIVMAASMFGAFELTLPDSVMQRISAVGGVGYGGAFTLGLVSGIVAAPCSGPVLISMMAAVTASQSVPMGITFGLSYAIGLGLLFWVVGTFAAGLPKGGKWMVWVKSFFGIVMLILAFYYLKNAFPELSSMAKNETQFLAIAGGIALFGLLLGAVHLNWDDGGLVVKARKGLGIAAAVVGGYLVVAGLDKPKEVSAEELARVQKEVLDKGEKVYPPMEFGPDLAGLSAEAIAQGRPLIVDFGAEWCAACKEIEKEVFANAEVKVKASRFLAARVDCTKDDDPQIKGLWDQYKVTGLPTVILFDASGKEVKRFNKKISAEEFLALIEPIK